MTTIIILRPKKPDNNLNKTRQNGKNKDNEEGKKQGIRGKILIRKNVLEMRRMTRTRRRKR